MPADRPHTISINHKNYESTDTWRLVHGAVIARRRRCCDGEIMDLKTTMMSWYLSDILPLEMLLLSRHTHQNESLQIWENNPFFSVISLALSGRIRRIARLVSLRSTHCCAAAEMLETDEPAGAQRQSHRCPMRWRCSEKWSQSDRLKRDGHFWGSNVASLRANEQEERVETEKEVTGYSRSTVRWMEL